MQKDDNLQEAGEVSQTLFVAPNGDDIRGDGTMEHPFATIERAIEAAEANGMDGGDQILLREGTYYPARPLKLSEKGTPQRWSRLAAWSGERAVIDGHRIPDAEDGPQSMIYVHGSYYELSSLELGSSRKSAISLYGEHVRVIGNVIHDSMGGAVYADPRQAGFLFFAGNVVYHNCLSNQKRNMPSGWIPGWSIPEEGGLATSLFGPTPPPSRPEPGWRAPRLLRQPAPVRRPLRRRCARVEQEHRGLSVVSGAERPSSSQPGGREP